MKNWSLNAKLYLVIGMLIVAGALSSWLGISRMSELNNAINGVIGTNVPRMMAAVHLRDLLRGIGTDTRSLILETDHAEMAKIWQGMNDTKTEIDSSWNHAYEIGSEKGREKLKVFKAEFDEYWAHILKVKEPAMKNQNELAYSFVKEGALLRQKAQKAIEEILQYNQQVLKEEELATNELYSVARKLMLTVGIVSSLLGLAIAFYVLRAVGRAIDQVIQTLSQASQQVAQSSQQIASASEQLSQASSEQAASLQETSSSLEELTSMVAKNTDNAKSASETAHESLLSAENGKATIQQMVGAIQELEKSNQQIADIVRVFGEIQEKTKVIEDIVFQTQLLSFNASVEAARAGEHGKGFAVVAEEVGNLAEMSGNASNEIATLLQNSLKQVEGTVEDIRGKIGHLVEQGGSGVKALETIVGGVNTSSSKANEIATASNEQSRGIQEINRAMTQLDQTTQQNAATSEEAASAAEELSGQAEALKSTVNELVAVIKGSSARATASTPAPGSKPHLNVVHLDSARKKAKPTEKPASTAAMKKAAGAEGLEADDSDFVNL